MYQFSSSATRGIGFLPLFYMQFKNTRCRGAPECCVAFIFSVESHYLSSRPTLRKAFPFDSCLLIMSASTASDDLFNYLAETSAVNDAEFREGLDMADAILGVEGTTIRWCQRSRGTIVLCQN
jgi:hypothetical protein